jgi:hypothetical protein
MSTPRTPDDGRNERQRQQAAEESARQKQREFDDGTHPAARGGVTSGPARRVLPKAEGDERRELLEEKPFDFIERTRPEDRLDPAGGQQTRDNVNPNIPSVTREEIGPATKRVPNPGGIVDPKRLGMESQAGVAPPEPENKVEQWPSLGLDHTKDAEDQKEEAENRQRQAREGSGGLGETDRLVSINEPPGSRVYTGEDGPNQIPDDPKHELPPLVLSDIDPDAAVVGSGSVALTVTGTGFTPNCVVVFDDAEVPTVFVSQTSLTADCPVSDVAEIVDVEVTRGEDMSDVLTFEFTAVARDSKTKREQQRKPKKTEPASKRTKKGKK